MSTMKKASSSSKLLETDPARRGELETVLKQFAANPKQKKLVDGAYVPCYGLTCVMPLRKDIIDTWAVPFFKLLAADPVVTSAIVLLPPSSYHVTLRGLEPMLPSFGPEHTLLLADMLSAAQADLWNMFRGQPISMKFADVPRPGSVGLKASETTERLLRAAEDMVVATQLAPNAPQEKDSKRRQRWHLTLGYTKDRNGEAAAQQRIAEIVKASGGYPPEFVLEAPEICTYRSMERFDPLFARR